MKNITEPSATEWLGRLKNGDVSSVELVNQTIARINEVNKELNAVVADDPETCIKQAHAADAQRRRGTNLPLLGLPITVKDSIDAVGFPCTGGSFARENFRPEQDSTMETPFRIPQDEYFLYRAFNYVHTFALAGLPVTVAPAGAQDGLPLGVQLAAQPFREDVALAVAAYLQENLG